VRLLEDAGFAVDTVAWTHSEVDRPLEMFIGRAL
jgi:hypothetical protein